jgi:uncharacterized protein (DUF1800 family)
MIHGSKWLLSGLLLVALAACDGGSGSDSSSTGGGALSSSSNGAAPSDHTASSSSASSSGSSAMSTADAARLLEQATFGPTASEVARVAALGFNGYMQEQLAKPPTGYSGFSYVPHTAATGCQFNASAPNGAASLCARDNYTPFQVQRQFFRNALTGSDQLRQRVAFALSQIFVVSGVEISEAYAMAAYQNMLLKDAFGNFRQLLQDVTLSPVMGHYLNMARNAKANPAQGTSPNENYAREIMQLFSIGLYQLNQDGSLQLDANGAPIPTYDQNVIDGFAALFTGWMYAPLPGAAVSWSAPFNFQSPMVSFPSYHDSTPKLLLNGVITPAGQSPEADLTLGLDTIFNHPNVGPFIGKQLIQHLVTSNPSPGYVARVAAVFANNGQGVRGDLGAVVQAILGDVEARGDAPSNPDAGHLREPALFMTTVLRALGGQSDGVWLRSWIRMGQSVFSSPTVFNFYPPSYELPGTSTLAPEFFIENAASTLTRANFVAQLIFGGGAPPDPTVLGSTGTSVNLSALAGSPALSPDALVDELNVLLMHGSLSSAAHGVIVTAVESSPRNDPLGPVKTAAYLIASSQQFQVEH